MLRTLLPSLTLLLIVTYTSVHGQLHPVQITPQLVPPYSVYLSDYATPGNDKLRLVVLQRDVTKPFYQIRLQLSVELNGSVIMRTSPAFRPAPITIDPGAPVIITGADLQPYLDSRNLDFSGFSREEYERTKALPEGSYQICFTAYDYNRQDVAVSQPGCNFFWLAKSEPPMLNFPSCGTAMPLQIPQQVIFSWMPRNTASANSADNTQYEFTLYETRPAGRNPNDVVLSSQPIYRITTTLTQLMYSAAEPLLLENMTYVWRVRAMDKSGRDLFRNNGYSETCTFTYGTVNSNIQLAAVTGLQAQPEAERRAKATWTAQDCEGYKVYYKKSGASYQWFSKDSPQDAFTLQDLEPDTQYETRVLAYVGAAYGPYSDIVKFKTPKKKITQCGDDLPLIDTVKAKPIAFLTQGMIIDVQGIELTITEVQGPKGDGIYAGKGQVTVPYFGASFNVIFKDLFITENQTASRGRIDFITKKIDTWIEDEIEQQKKEALAEKQEENREAWKDTDFYDKIIYYGDDVISNAVADDEGQIIITTEDGRTFPDAQIAAILKDAPEKAIIIEDKEGNQWVVQKDPATGDVKVTPVEGGGLSPNMNVNVSADALKYIQEALTSLGNEYDDIALATLERKLIESRARTEAVLKEIQQDGATAADNTDTPAGVDTSGDMPVWFPPEDMFNTPAFTATGWATEEMKNRVMINGLTERERNRAIVLNAFGKMTDTEDLADVLGREVRTTDQKTVSDFIKDRQSQKTPHDTILNEVKDLIKTNVDTLIAGLPKEPLN